MRWGRDLRECHSVTNDKKLQRLICALACAKHARMACDNARYVGGQVLAELSFKTLA